MSNLYTTYLMLGTRLDGDKVVSANLNNTSWLPYCEGNPEVIYQILASNDNDDIYFGKVIASYDKYDSTPNYTEYFPTVEDLNGVTAFLKEVGFEYPVPQLMFFTTVN